MSKKYILFDLDGTVTDSSEGITKSVQHALLGMGIEETSMSNLRRFIGPPLDESFMMFYNMSREDALKAVSFYRERYGETGIFENKLYDGVKELLETLRENGYVTALATCKPEIYVPRILKYFDIYDLFDIAVGSELEGGSRRHKNEVIEEVFRQIIIKYNLSQDSLNEIKADSIMIGDRKDDINGAKLAGIESMGVRYGFAEPEELENAGADYIVPEVSDIFTMISEL
ncbi:MAG: HAD hydrolase-like protein [Eubacteriales bacterium]|nr:HAD hydrolase-like protein [Eubacteriales bacterium]